MSNTVKSRKILLLAQLGIFTAIEAVFCFTPLGSMPITPGIVATLAHIPALVVALSLGKRAGLYMGAVMGIFSLIIWTFMPPNALVAFCFTPFAPNGSIMSAVISIVPRTLFPVAAAFVYEKHRNRIKAVPAAIAAGAVGTFAHTIMVLSLIFIAFFGNEVIGSDYISFILAWAGLNAVFEIIIGALVCGALIVPINKVNRRFS